MATLALSKSFLSDLGGMSKPIQAKVQQTIETFRQLNAQELRSLKGLHLEPYSGARDDRAKTIRIDSNHRGVVLDVGDNEHYVLCRIGTHDVIDRWMMNNTFRVNEATGALEVIDEVRLSEAVQRHTDEDSTAGAASLFEHRRDRDFVNLGIAADLVPVLRALSTADQLLALAEILPRAQADAVLRLTDHDPVESIYAEIAGDVHRDDVDATDLVASLTAPATRSELQVIATEDDLQEVVAKPLAHWRLFLHPSQRALVDRETYNGPVRVTGGAGTGKTVVAIHRAVALARRANGTVGRPILFTTYTKNLAQAIDRDVRELGGADPASRIEVINVDALAHRIVTDAEDRRPLIADQRDVEKLFNSVLDEQGFDQWSAAFVINEWEQVVLAQGCRSRSDYFNASRAGRGVRLDRRQRAAVWKVIEEASRRLTESGKRTWTQLAVAAEGYLRSRSVKPYEHVVVDEAQDLHEAQWRLLRAAVAEQPNDMFIVGDSHQRIYDRRSSLSRVGINIVGRSRKLRINYRTTHEILRFGLGVLGDAEFDDLDEGTDTHTLGGYHSYLHGPRPTVVVERSQQAEYNSLIEQLQQWIAGGVPPEAIAVTARTGDRVSGIAALLRQRGIDAVELAGDQPTSDGVRVGTMHRLKGLEFQCVAVADCDIELMPFHAALTPVGEDDAQRELDLRRERCLLYVACTRARDLLWVGAAGKPSPFLPN